MPHRPLRAVWGIFRENLIFRKGPYFSVTYKGVTQNVTKS